MYVGGVCPENSVDDIKYHISSLGIDSCGKIQILSNGGDWKSFKVKYHRGRQTPYVIQENGQKECGEALSYKAGKMAPQAEIVAVKF